MKNRDAILGKISNIRNCLFSIRNVTGMDPVALTDQIKPGFRNIAIHDYVKLDVKILQSILTSNLTDIEDYCEAIHKAIVFDR